MGTHKETGQFYFGFSANKKQKLPSHLDLGSRYFTSSKYVKNLGFDNFSWIILAEFFDAEAALLLERELISTHWKNPLLLNKNIGGEKWSTVGIECSDETKQKISKSNKGKILSEEHKAKLALASTGFKHSEETKEFCRQINLGKKRTEEELANMRKPRKNTKNMKNKIRSEEHCKNLSLANKGKPRPQPKTECPYCSKVGAAGLMKRYHFDNCKLK
jgi:hypothetical protein